MRPIAGNAALRPFQSVSRSCSSRAVRTSVAPLSVSSARTCGDLLGDLLVRAVELAQQDGLGIGRVAGVHEVLGRPDREPIHHLQPRRDDAGRDDAAHRSAGPLDVVEGREDHLRALGHGSSRTVTSTITPSMPSEPVISASRS